MIHNVTRKRKDPRLAGSILKSIGTLPNIRLKDEPRYGPSPMHIRDQIKGERKAVREKMEEILGLLNKTRLSKSEKTKIRQDLQKIHQTLESQEFYPSR